MRRLYSVTPITICVQVLNVNYYTGIYQCIGQKVIAAACDTIDKSFLEKSVRKCKSYLNINLLL